MNTRDFSTPAFPVDNRANINGHPGMTLRDWFAGQALVAIGEWAPEGASDPHTLSDILERRAAWAYRQADHMISERELMEGE